MGATSIVSAFAKGSKKKVNFDLPMIQKTEITEPSNPP